MVLNNDGHPGVNSRNSADEDAARRGGRARPGSVEANLGTLSLVPGTMVAVYHYRIYRILSCISRG